MRARPSRSPSIARKHPQVSSTATETWSNGTSKPGDARSCSRKRRCFPNSFPAFQTPFLLSKLLSCFPNSFPAFQTPFLLSNLLSSVFPFQPPFLLSNLLTLLLGPSLFPNSFSNFSLFFGPRSDSKGVFTLWIEYPLGSGQVLPQGKVGDLMQQVYKAAKAKYEELERKPQVPLPKQSHLKKKPGYGTDQAQEKRTRHNTPNSWKDIVALVETRGLRFCGWAW